VAKRLRLEAPARPGKRRAAWEGGQEGPGKRSRTSAGPCTALVPYTAPPFTGLGLPRALTLHLALPAVPSSLAPSARSLPLPSTPRAAPALRLALALPLP
jgi:hypothetical protein